MYYIYPFLTALVAGFVVGWAVNAISAKSRPGALIGAAYGGAIVGLIAYIVIASVIPSADLWLYVTLWIVLPIGGAVLAASLVNRSIKPATD